MTNRTSFLCQITELSCQIALVGSCHCRFGPVVVVRIECCVANAAGGGARTMLYLQTGPTSFMFIRSNSTCYLPAVSVLSFTVYDLLCHNDDDERDTSSTTGRLEPLGWLAGWRKLRSFVTVATWGSIDQTQYTDNPKTRWSFYPTDPAYWKAPSWYFQAATT